METLKRKLGARIKELRCKNGMTQEKFAELVCLDRRSISNIECGKTFPSTSIEQIAKVLKVETKELFDFDSLEKTDKELTKSIVSRLSNLNTEQLRIIYRLIEIL